MNNMGSAVSLALAEEPCPEAAYDIGTEARLSKESRRAKVDADPVTLFADATM